MPVNTSWSAPATASGSGGLDMATGDVLTEAIWDRLASNLNKIGGSDGVLTQVSLVSGSVSGPTTASTTYVDLSDMAATFTTRGGPLIAICVCTMSNSTGGASNNLALSLDAASEVGVQQQTLTSANDQVPLTAIYLWTGVSAASHTVKARWKTSAGTATATSTMRNMIVVELTR